MERNNLRFFAIFAVLITIILSLYFVLAGIDAPTGLMFDRNDTADYDNDGSFTVNWTAGASDGAENYSIYIYADDVLYTVGLNDTDAVTAFSYTNITDDGNYTFTISGFNATISGGVNSTNISMVIDTTIPAVLYTTGTESDNAATNNDWIFVNVTATDINNVSSSIVFSLHNSSGVVNQTQYSYPTSGEQAINWTGLVSNVAYTYNVTGNDSATNSNVTPTRTLTLDNVAPAITLTKLTSGQTSLELSISGKEGTCTVDRSGATISGSTVTETSLSCGNTYTYTVTCTDTAGNAGSSSATSFSTTGCSSGTTTSPPKKSSSSFSKITPGVVTIVKNFDAEIGIKQIQIEVNNEAQNVQISVTKYDGKPAAVSVEKSGKVYRYLQIEATNLAGKLDKAIVTIQVTKSWLSGNAVAAENIALFRFDGVSDQWNELVTTHIGSEGDNELYDVELTSFSFFAVGEKSAVGEAAEEEEGSGIVGAIREGANLVWLWILIAVVVLVFIGLRMKKRER